MAVVQGDGGQHKAAETEFRELWQKRPALDERGWARVWELLQLGLRRCRPAHLSAMQDTFDDLVSEFFLCKIFEPRLFHSSAPDHFGALCVYFSRFLLDRLPTAGQVSLDEERDRNPDDDDAGGCGCDQSRLDASWSGLDGKVIMASASEFFARLPEWARVYLACSICPDDEREPLYKLSARMNIASHHYKAQKLGVTRAKGDSWATYENTLIGAWIKQDLKVPVDLDHQDEILAALSVLCLVALQMPAIDAPPQRKTPNA